MHVPTLPQNPLTSRLPHNIEQSSLCYRVGSCWLSILNIAVTQAMFKQSVSYRTHHQKIQGNKQTKRYAPHSDLYNLSGGKFAGVYSEP